MNPWQTTLEGMLAALRNSSAKLDDVASSYIINPDALSLAINTVRSAIVELDGDLRNQLEQGGTVHGTMEATWAAAVDLYNSAQASAAQTLTWDQIDHPDVTAALQRTGAAVGSTAKDIGNSIGASIPWVVVGLGFLVVLAINRRL